MARRRTALRGTARRGTARRDAARHSQGTAQRGPARGAARRRAERHGTARHCTARRRAARHSTARHGTSQHEPARHGTARRCTARHSPRYCITGRRSHSASASAPIRRIAVFLRENTIFWYLPHQAGCAYRRTRFLLEHGPPQQLCPAIQESTWCASLFSRATPESQGAAGGWCGGALVRYLRLRVGAGGGAGGGWSGCVLGGKCTSVRFPGFARKSSVSRNPRFFVV